MDQLDAIAAHEHGARAMQRHRGLRGRAGGIDAAAARGGRSERAGARRRAGGEHVGRLFNSVRPSAAAGGAFDRVASIPPKVASMPPPLPGIAPPPSMVGRGDLPPADAAASAMSSVEARLNAARVSGMAAGRRNSGAR